MLLKRDYETNFGVLPATRGHCLPEEGGASGLSPRQTDLQATRQRHYTAFNRVRGRTIFAFLGQHACDQANVH